MLPTYAEDEVEVGLDPMIEFEENRKRRILTRLLTNKIERVFIANIEFFDRSPTCLVYCKITFFFKKK